MTVLGYLSIMLGILFWIFRVIVTFTTTMNIDFVVQPLNLNVEIVLLFVTVLCFFFIFRRKMIGALAYLLLYLGYFGVDAYKAITDIAINGSTTASSLDLAISIIAVVIAFVIFIEVGLSESRKKGSGSDKETNWFYGTNNYERKYDERADKNQYKF